MYGLKKPSVSHLWKNTRFVCLEHDDTTEEDICKKHIMTPREYYGKIYYACSDCTFMIPYYEIEKCIDKIIGFLTVDDEDEDEEVNLKNIRWNAIEKSAGVKYEYRILYHREDKITVGIKKVAL